GEGEGQQLLGLCRKMLDTQTTVCNDTKRLHQVIQGRADKKPRPEDRQAALELAGTVKGMVTQASKAIELLEAEEGAVAFREVLRTVREDLKGVQGRLEARDARDATQAGEQHSK